MDQMATASPVPPESRGPGGWQDCAELAGLWARQARANLGLPERGFLQDKDWKRYVQEFERLLDSGIPAK